MRRSRCATRARRDQRAARSASGHMKATTRATTPSAKQHALAAGGPAVLGPGGNDIRDDEGRDGHRPEEVEMPVEGVGQLRSWDRSGRRLSPMAGPARLDRLERVTDLVLVLLNTEQPLTLDAIALQVPGYPEEHSARRQAFERDKRLLRDEGIPVQTQRLRRAGTVRLPDRPRRVLPAGPGARARRASCPPPGRCRRAPRRS